MLSRMPLGPTLALKIMVCAVGWPGGDPGMLFVDGNTDARGLSRLRAMMSFDIFESLASVLLGCVLFEMSCIFVADTTLAGTLLVVTVSLHESVLVSM